MLWRCPLRNEESQHHASLPQPGSQFQEGKSQNSWLWKPVGIMTEWDGVQLESQIYLLQTHTQMWTHFLWASALRQQFKRHQGHMGSNWIVWLQKKDWRCSFLLDGCASRGHCSFKEPFPTTTELADRCHIWVSITLVHIAHLALVSPWNPVPQTCGPTQAISSGFSIQMPSLGSCFWLS